MVLDPDEIQPELVGEPDLLHGASEVGRVGNDEDAELKSHWAVLLGGS
jgi:hypothetical protein